MTTLNSYATLAEFKSYFTSRGGATLSTDTADDAVLEQLLKAASDYIDTKTQRRFIPTVETRYFDVPDVESVDPRVLQLDGDLLEIISITNGDGEAIASTEVHAQAAQLHALHQYPADRQFNLLLVE